KQRDARGEVADLRIERVGGGRVRKCDRRATGVLHEKAHEREVAPEHRLRGLEPGRFGEGGRCRDDAVSTVEGGPEATPIFRSPWVLLYRAHCLGDGEATEVRLESQQTFTPTECSRRGHAFVPREYANCRCEERGRSDGCQRSAR